MLCSDPKLDSHRFKDILDEVIAAGKGFLFVFSLPEISLLIFNPIFLSLEKTENL